MSARSLNKVMLIGNLTRDPELRYTPNGAAVCTFGLATNRSYTPSDGGEAKEETEYHRLVAWGKLAEICSQLLYKGRKVYCDGRLQTRKWTGQDGQERTSTEVVLENMIALSPPRGMGGGREDEGGYGSQAEYSQEPVADDSIAVANAEPVADDQAVPAEVDEGEKKPTNTAKPADEVDVDDIPF